MKICTHLVVLPQGFPVWNREQCDANLKQIHSFFRNSKCNTQSTRTVVCLNKSHDNLLLHIGWKFTALIDGSSVNFYGYTIRKITVPIDRICLKHNLYTGMINPPLWSGCTCILPHPHSQRLYTHPGWQTEACDRIVVPSVPQIHILYMNHIRKSWTFLYICP